ncbi:hypothetical protein [Phenylobacterium soli]|uniref:hypothetical protein n=1 Tax=Phenylobacterium soli TaxID=2170551 RepID=UPI001D0369D7|nr:hypothetical protein [Phenylobacterium soli]
MNRLTFTAVVSAALVLSACDQSRATNHESEPAHAASAGDVDRCSKGGMAAANDPTCKAASDQRFREFLDGGGDREHRNR